MSDQPIALQLADAIEDRRDWYEFDPSAWCPQAAAELRRLHALNAKLVEALQALYDEQNGPPLIWHEAKWHAAMDAAREALAKVVQ